MTAFPRFPPDTDTHLATLPNGVRVLAIRLPQLQTVSISLFVRSGSAHESAALNGISHVVEHMVFKGTTQRDARRINLDAERLGAEVNAHTDKDHTAFHMHGLAVHAPRLVAMLAELVSSPTFPDAELDSERQVLLQEHMEDEDDPMATAFRLFDHACYGLHPVARPVIGSRRNIERLARADLAGWVARQYTGANVIVAVAGGIDVDALVKEAERCLGALPAGEPNRVAAPAWVGGLRSRKLVGSGQTHAVLGLPIARLADDDPVPELAAVLFGEGMSSPLMAELRERRGLVYYAACSADALDLCGEFVVEASFAPDKQAQVLGEVAKLLRAQAEAIAPDDLERAHNQITVRRLRARERPERRLEAAALDLYALGRLRSSAERVERVRAVTAEQLRATFQRMLEAPVALALAGRLGRSVTEQAASALGGLKLAAHA